MKSIRNFAYALMLTLSSLTLLPSPASAQEAGGSFTLAHEVRWQNAIVPAGDYRFSIEPKGPSKLLVVRKINGGAAGFMMVVKDVESGSGSDISRLVLLSQSGKSYVSAMELPAFDMTLHFAVPSEAAAKEVAAAETGTGSGASSAR